MTNSRNKGWWQSAARHLVRMVALKPGRAVRMVAIAAVAVLTLGMPAGAADFDTPQSGQTYHVAAAQLSGRIVHLSINKSVVYELPEAISDVLVSDPKIADAMIRTQKRIYLIGMSVGDTNIILYGQDNHEIAHFDVHIDRDVGDLSALLARLIPGSAIKVEAVNGAVALSGAVLNPQDITKATSIATQFVGAPVTGGATSASVINLLTTATGEQVHLKVVVAEVEREVIKNLGINTQTLLGDAGIGWQQVITNGQSTISKHLGLAVPAGTSSNTTDTLNDFVSLLQQNSLLRTLAEPSLTATSGEQASFLAGGEFPIPSTGANGQISITFQKYGVGLNFTPVVLGPGRLSLHIETEVSELSSTGAVTIDSITIPALTVRRASSTLELPSGGSIVMAGMMRNNVTQVVQGYPGVMDLPVIGPLFRSRQFTHQETELAVFVTPYIVGPTNPDNLKIPGQNMHMTGDAEAVFLDKLNQTYHPGSPEPAPNYQGRIGFTFD